MVELHSPRWVNFLTVGTRCFSAKLVEHGQVLGFTFVYRRSLFRVGCRILLAIRTMVGGVARRAPRATSDLTVTIPNSKLFYPLSLLTY